MSAETQPDPILPNYNPSSWDVPTLSPEERAILDTEYITFPIAQNQDITFPVSPVAPTLPNGTSTDQVATAGFVQNAITALKSAVNTWFGFNTFNGGLSATSITRTGTLTITGTPLALTNTRLDTALVPNYTYPVASNQIGYIESVSPSPVAYPTLNADVVLASLTLTAGVWLLVGEAGLDIASNNVIVAGFNTTTSLTSARGLQSMNFANSSTSQPALTINYVLSINASTTYNFIGKSALAITPAYNFNGIVFSATRLA
jgi:hypothetical protein